eukprot:m.73212 g.73212  ORF g.73212 m.73212 type:complete len:51 (-) comp12361_c0_seq3:248-400(-)
MTILVIFLHFRLSFVVEVDFVWHWLHFECAARLLLSPTPHDVPCIEVDLC